MSEVTFLCTLCDFETKSYSGSWRTHLLEEHHQERTRKRSDSLTESDKRRCAVVFGLRDLPLFEILQFFSSNWLLTDLIFWNDRPDFCIVEFLTESFCRIAGSTKSIYGKEVVIRFRDEISDIEWTSIRPCSGLVSTCPRIEAEDDVIILEQVKMEPMEEGATLSTASLNVCSEIDSGGNEEMKEAADLKKLKKNGFSIKLFPQEKLSNQAAKWMKGSSFQERIKSMDKFSVELVKEFNSLVWDNLFGIQLHEIPPEEGRRRNKCPWMRGILCATEKISSWTLTEENGLMIIPAKVKLHPKKREFLKSLKSGLLEPKPTLQNSSSPFAEALLTFDLRIRRYFPYAKRRAKSKDTPIRRCYRCNLQFTNIFSPHQICLKQLQLVKRMYRLLWREFCAWKLKQNKNP